MRIILSLLILFCLGMTTQKKMIKIAVIDTGFTKHQLSKVKICGQKDFTGKGITDTHSHGTHITEIIDRTAQKYNGNYCFILIKAYDMAQGKQYVPEAFEYLETIKPDIINLSGGGDNPIPKEQRAIKRLLKKGVTIVVAAGNDSRDLNKFCNYFPACYDKRIIVVGNYSKSSNYGNVVDVILNGNNIDVFGIVMSGTSQSTALFTGLLTNNLVRDRLR